MSAENIDPTVSKERALFFLDRRIKQLEVEVKSQLQMAKDGLSYSQRIAAGEQADVKESENQLELGALRWTREVVKNT